MASKIYFTERQKATQKWLWILMGVLILMAVYFTYEITLQTAADTNTEDIVFLVIGWLVILSTFLLLIVFRIDTSISDEGVFVKVFPFHTEKVKYAWEDIEKIYVREYNPIMEYGGWGIRGIGKNRAFNAKGNMGIQLRLKDCRKRLIGTSIPVKAEKAISEVENNRFQGNFSKQAEAYSQYRPSYPDLLFQHIYTHCSAFDCAWDVGCGNGQVTNILAKKFRNVTGTDISNQQLQYAQNRPNITYKVGEAETLELKQQFDLITVAQALHWFDRESFYKNVKKHLKPEGVLAVFGYGHAQIDEQVNPVLDRLFYEILDDYWDPAIRLVKNEYRDIEFPFHELDSPAFFYHAKWSLEQLLGFFESWSAVQTYKDKVGKDPVDIIRNDLVSTWGSDKVKTIKFPVFLRLGKMH